MGDAGDIERSPSAPKVKGDRPGVDVLVERHLAKTVAGLVQRIAQRLLALTLSVFLNILIGRPPRALAAYDGR